jgi:hypothetical protein
VSVESVLGGGASATTGTTKLHDRGLCGSLAMFADGLVDPLDLSGSVNIRDESCRSSRCSAVELG